MLNTTPLTQDLDAETRPGPSVRLAGLMTAVANSDRLALLETIRAHRCERGCGVTELADAVGLSRFAASHHLGILRHYGLLQATRHKGHVLHRLVMPAFEMIEDWVITFTAG
jgi:DNA-binding transcriptional ArsR family regulator